MSGKGNVKRSTKGSESSSGKASPVAYKSEKEGIMIYFDQERHLYYNAKGEIYDSPSKIFKKYKQKFDAKTVAENYAKKHGQTPEYWLEQWKQKSDKALSRGTAIHNQKEELDLGMGFTRTVTGQIVQVENAERFLVDDLYKLPDGAYPEINLWNHGWKIAGRPDKVILETVRLDGAPKRYAHIEDYKTNRKIDKTSYFNPRTESYKMMLGPLAHLMDCSWVHYMLQFSTYQFMLETHGFTPGLRTLIHIPHPIVDENGNSTQPEDVLYKMPYAKTEILNTLEDYNRTRRYSRVQQ